MYKYINKMTPDVFDNFFSSISDIHQYETRNATIFVAQQEDTKHKSELSN